MIDLHSHVLPGLDDGVSSMTEAVQLGAAAAAQGTRVLAATPHVRDDYPTTPAAMESGLADVRAALRGAGVGIELIEGGEIDLRFLARLSDDDLLRFSYGARGTAVLLEMPERAWPRELEPALARATRLGVRPVLAHPERNAAVQANPEILRSAVADGAVGLLTGLAFVGDLGRTARKTATRLIAAGLGHAVASDAHGPEVRPYVLAAVADAVRDPALARFLLEDAPAAVLAGDTLPLPPGGRRRRGLSVLRG